MLEQGVQYFSRSILRFVLASSPALAFGPGPASAGTITIEYQITGLPQAPRTGSMTLVVPGTDVSTIAGGLGSLKSFTLFQAGRGLQFLTPVPILVGITAGTFVIFPSPAVLIPIATGPSLSVLRTAGVQLDGFGAASFHLDPSGFRFYGGPIAVQQATYPTYHDYFDPGAGQEVARTFVPEPAPSVLLGIAAAALGARVLHRFARARA